MHKSACIALFLLLINLLQPFAQVSPLKESVNGQTFYIHTVKQGETVFAIAKLYGVSDKLIFENNPGSDLLIKAGQKLKIPDLSKPRNINTQPNSNTYQNHKVEKGETLYGIAKKYAVEYEDILAANPGLKEKGLRHGETIRIPSKNDVKNTPVNQQQTQVTPPKQEITVTADITNPIPTENKKVISKNAAPDECNNPANQKEEYHIAVLLPFGNSEKTDPEIKTQRIAYQFLGGLKTAFELHKPVKAKFQIHVFNTINAEDLNSVKNILEREDFKKCDLIIGPLYTANFKPVSEYAKKNNIPAVAPMARMNSIIEDNPWVHKCTPSPETFTESLVKYMSARFKAGNIILLNAFNGPDSVRMNKMYDSLKIAFKYRPDAVRMIHKTSDAAGALKEGLENLIYFPTQRELQVNTFLLNTRKVTQNYDVSIMGDESWLNFKNFDIDYFSNARLRIPVVNFGTTSDTLQSAFVEKFRSDYKMEPENYAFKAFSIACFYIDVLEKYGTRCNDCLYLEKVRYLQTPFAFRRDAGKGWENRGVGILVLDGYDFRFESN